MGPGLFKQSGNLICLIINKVQLRFKGEQQQQKKTAKHSTIGTDKQLIRTKPLPTTTQLMDGVNDGV